MPSADRIAFRLGDAAASLLAILPSPVGMWFGQKIRRRVSPPVFRRWFLICLFLLGLQLLLRPLWRADRVVVAGGSAFPAIFAGNPPAPARDLRLTLT